MHIDHDPDKHQFITVIEDKPATLSYSVLPGEKTWDYYSTFVPPELRGRHIGQDLVKFALDYAIKNGYKIIPSCPFVRSYIGRHAEYLKVVKSQT